MSYTRYVCSKCSGPVDYKRVTGIPTKDIYECIDCGAKKEEIIPIKEVIVDFN